VNGRKRHLLVDTLGLVCKVHVTPADISDRDGATGLLRRVDWRRFPRLRYGWVDQGYRGEFLAQLKQAFGVTLQVVVRGDGGRRSRWLPPGAEPPVALPSRWCPAVGWWSALLHGWAGPVGWHRTTSSARRPRRR